PGPAATPDLAEDDAEADRQLGPPAGRVQPWPAQEREQLVAMGPQVPGQTLVGRVRLGREDQIRQLVLRATAGRGQSAAANFARRVAVAQVQAGPEQLSHSTRAGPVTRVPAKTFATSCGRRPDTVSGSGAVRPASGPLPPGAGRRRGAW